MGTDESEIVGRLKSGDQSALTIVLREIVPELWPLLLRTFREALSHEDIEEVIATALSRLWQSRERFDASKGDLQGWFYVILRNCALDRIRRNAPRTEEFLVVESVSDSSPPSEEEQQELVRAALAGLNDREQQVVLPLFDRSGVSVSELSENLSMTTGAVRQLRFRALRRLNSILGEHGYTTRRVRQKSSSR